MKILYLDIFYEDGFTDDDNTKSKFTKLFSQNYNISDDEDVSKIHNEVHDMILEKYRDGLNIIIDEFKDFIFFRISLLFGDDCEFLIAYFEEKFEAAKEEKVNNFLEEDNRTLLCIDYTDTNIEDELESIVKELEQNGIDAKIESITQQSFECGADSYLITAIISISAALVGSIASEIIDYVKRKKKEKEYLTHYITYGDFDEQKLLLNVARRYNDDNIKKCRITQFEEYTDYYSITLSNRYVSYRVKADKDSNIIESNATYYI